MQEVKAEPSANQLVPVQEALTEFEKVSAGLLDLSSRYANVVYAVQTTKGMDEAKAARLAIREPRYAVQRATDAAKKELNSIKRNVEQRAEQITSALLRLEEPVDAQIKAEEERKAAEKARKEAEELARISAIRARVEGIASAGNELVGKSSTEIHEALERISAIEIDASFDEFIPQAADAKDKTVSTLIRLHATAVATEEAQAALAAQQEELQRQREEIERQRRELEEARNAADAARRAEQQRLDEAYARQLAEENARAAEEARLAAIKQDDAFAEELKDANKVSATEGKTPTEMIRDVIPDWILNAHGNPRTTNKPAEVQIVIDEIINIEAIKPDSVGIVQAVADAFDVSMQQALEWIVGINVNEVNQAIAEAA